MSVAYQGHFAKISKLAAVIGMEDQPKSYLRVGVIAVCATVCVMSVALVLAVGAVQLMDTFTGGEAGSTGTHIGPNGELSTQDGTTNSVSRWTKSEFSAYAIDKTKKQIRTEFGPPDSVDDESDSWYYWNIPVYDAEAGTPVRSTIIRFSGLDGSDDFVADVRYN